MTDKSLEFQGIKLTEKEAICRVLRELIASMEIELKQFSIEKINRIPDDYDWINNTDFLMGNYSGYYNGQFDAYQKIIYFLEQAVILLDCK